MATKKTPCLNQLLKKMPFTHTCSLLNKQYVFILPVKYTPDFITNSNNLNFFPSCCKVGRLAFHLFSNRGVNSTTEPSVRGHTDDEVLLLVFSILQFHFDVSNHGFGFVSFPWNCFYTTLLLIFYIIYQFYFAWEIPWTVEPTGLQSM